MDIVQLCLPRYLAQLGTVAVVSTLCWAVYRILTDPLHHIPGPWYARFTNLVIKYKVLTGHRIFYIDQLHRKYGPLVRVDPNEVNVSDLDTYREIHRIGGGFIKSEWYDLATPGIEIHAFTMRKPLVTDRARLAIAKMKEEAEQGDCDAMKWWTLMTTDVITQVAFGTESKLLEAGHKTQYIDDLESVVKAWHLKGELPIYYHFLQVVSPAFVRECERCLKSVVEYGKKAALQARTGLLQRSNIISGMITESQAEGTTLTDHDLGSQASALIVAGSGTTAVTLTYAVWAVLLHPQIKAKLEEEVCSLRPDFDDTVLEKLPYLRAVIIESLRLYGSAPGALPRQTPSKGLEINGQYIPPGVTLTTQSFTMHRDPAIFPDPETFDPERFYQKELVGAQKYAFGPFGAGTRTCLGIHLAEMELRHGLAEFFRECRHFELSERTTPESMEIINYFLISPKSKSCWIKKKDKTVKA